ncbi:MAG: quinone-interacting membrane-bound oxidoreductase complex subunit QmoC [Nitrospirae bacterium]|nr:quinone-interacting membrane-bound oxidoreductase complex subunit QmoC [Nitrospirota bacterium]
MAEDMVLTPDLNFIRELKNSGAETLKKCYQCATCSVVCDISGDKEPFPRKQMHMAQWGLKDELLKDANIWLCHNCNDCSKNCPRGAAPADVLATLRKAVIRENAFPPILGGLGDSKPLNILIALLIPVILLTVVFLRGHFGIPEGDIVYSKLFPLLKIDILFTTTFVLAAIFFAISIINFWKNINKEPEKLRASDKKLIPALIETLIEFATHKKFNKCGESKNRFLGHLLVVIGFVLLAIVTNWSLVTQDILDWKSPFVLDDHAMEIFGSFAIAKIYFILFKLTANIGAISLLLGVGLLILNRLKERSYTSLTSSFDWTLLGIVLTVCVTGILAEFTRIANIPNIAYPIYFIHLVTVFYVIAYLPYSKLAHMVYRLTAITYAKMANID